MRILFNHESLRDDVSDYWLRRESSILQRTAEGSSRLLRRARIGLRRFLRDVERRRQARANYEVLRRLDSATLRDVGLTLDEVKSVAAEAVFWQSASAGFRVRKAEMFLSVAVLAAFAGVVSVAFKAPEVLAAWRGTVLFV